MARKLEIKSPYIVVEGIATTDEAPVDEAIANTLNNDRYILYSGTLNYKFGIKVLLDAFEKITDESLRLVICGFGEAEELIKEKQIMY